MHNTKLYIVVPCYNEDEVLFLTCEKLLGIFEKLNRDGQISGESKIVFIDDGSRDNTWNIIEMISERNHFVEGVKLSKNSGHQNALLAGLMAVRGECDCCISVDADLQDDVDVIPKFIEKYHGGCDVVYGVRNRRETDTWFKRTTAKGFYKLLKLLGADVTENHADYRLLSSRALDALAEFPEVNLFLRGMVKLLGFSSDVVYYERKERAAGVSKYPLKKMLSFAFDGVTSFSVKPIRLVWALGVFVCFLAIIAAIYTICSWAAGTSVTGWSSLMISIWFLGGVQLVSIGIIGEYVGKAYKEVKRRPRYIIEEKTWE